MNDTIEHGDGAPERVSKSQKKRDSSALQDLATKLVRLSRHELESLKLDDKLMEALKIAQAIKKPSAQRRQIKYIGGLLRNADAQSVYQKLDTLTNRNAEAHRHHHALEKWRERLLTEGKIALTELLGKHPNLDGQAIRQLIRTAHKESTAAKPPSASRALYRYLREHLDQKT